MREYHVTFNTKNTIVNKVVNGFNIRYAKHATDCLMALNPEFIHVQIFSKNGVYSRTRKTPWIFYNEKVR